MKQSASVSGVTARAPRMTLAGAVVLAAVLVVPVYGLLFALHFGLRLALP